MRRNADLARAVAVAVGAVVAVVVSFLGAGVVIGTPVAEAAGGAFAADATLVAPAGPAFSIWSVIYAGLLALAAFQFAPARRADPRQRATGWLVLASMLLNAAWILCVQAGWVVATVPVIGVLLAVLVVTWVRLVRQPPSTMIESVVVDGTIGLYLGWVSIATVADVAAALVDRGADRTGPGATASAVVVLVVAAATGVLLAVIGRGRLAPAAALAWGLAWIAVARSGAGDGPPSTAVVAVALLAAAVTVITTLAVRLRPGASR